MKPSIYHFLIIILIFVVATFLVTASDISKLEKRIDLLEEQLGITEVINYDVVEIWDVQVVKKDLIKVKNVKAVKYQVNYFEKIIEFDTGEWTVGSIFYVKFYFKDKQLIKMERIK